MVPHDAAGEEEAGDDGRAATRVHHAAAGEQGPGGGWDARQELKKRRDCASQSPLSKNQRKGLAKRRGNVCIRCNEDLLTRSPRL